MDSETYKYLGIEENSTIDHRDSRRKAKKEYIRRVKKILKTQLTAKNKIMAINQFALPVLTYGFGIVEWPQNELTALDVKTRKLLTINKLINRNQCMDRIYIPRREGGLGLCGVDDRYRSQIIGLADYLLGTKDHLLEHVVKVHQDLPENKSIIKLATLFSRDMEDSRSHGQQQQPQTPPSTETETGMVTSSEESGGQTGGRKKQFIEWERRSKHQRWDENHRAGRMHQELQKNYIDKQGSTAWIRNGELPYDQERMIIAAQDQGHMTNGFKKLIGRAESDKCRFCHQVSESCSHLLSGCQVLLADGHYTKRHNRVCKYLHWKILNDLKIPVKESWLHEPAPVTTNSNGKVVVFYDKIITAGRFIESSAIRPDLVVWDKENRTAQIIDVCVPNDYGLNRAEREKVTKYQDLKNDLNKTWDLRSIEVLPVVVGATGLMKTNLQIYLDQIPGKPSKYQVQGAAIRGSVSLLKKALGTAFS